MKSIDNSLLEAAESMGSFGLKRIVTVVLPLLVPTLLAAALLVFMRAFSDFGTPMLIGEGYRTFPVLIYTQFISEVGGNSAFASALAIMAITIALVIFLIQKYVSNRYSFSMNSLHPIEPKKTTKGKMAAIYVTVLWHYLILCFASSLLDLYILPKNIRNGFRQRIFTKQL